MLEELPGVIRDAHSSWMVASFIAVLVCCLFKEMIMKKFAYEFQRFLRDEDGVTAIEYGLIAALIAIAIIVGAALVGTNLNTLFNRIGACLSNPSAAC